MSSTPGFQLPDVQPFSEIKAKKCLAWAVHQTKRQCSPWLTHRCHTQSAHTGSKHPPSLEENEVRKAIINWLVHKQASLPGNSGKFPGHASFLPCPIHSAPTENLAQALDPNLTQQRHENRPTAISTDTNLPKTKEPRQFNEGIKIFLQKWPAHTRHQLLIRGDLENELHFIQVSAIQLVQIVFNCQFVSGVDKFQNPLQAWMFLCKQHLPGNGGNPRLCFNCPSSCLRFFGETEALQTNCRLSHSLGEFIPKREPWVHFPRCHKKVHFV